MAKLHAVGSLLHALDGSGPPCASFEVASGRCVGLWVVGLSEIHRVYRLLWLLRGVLVLALLICLSHLRKRLSLFAVVSRAVGMEDGLGLVVLR